MSAALRLRQTGLSVTVLERGVCGREASWAAAGIIAPENPHRKDQLHVMQSDSLDAYASFCAELQEISGIDPQYLRCGALQLLTTRQFVQMAESDVRVAADRKTEDGQPILEMITLNQRLALEPAVTGESEGALLCRRTAQIRNPRMMQALGAGCAKLGVVIHENARVGALLLEGDRVVGARTEGQRWEAEWTVLCAGAWSTQIGVERRCGSAATGLSGAPTAELARLIPVHPVKGQIILLQCPERSFDRVIHQRHTYLVPRNDGLVLLGATIEPESGFDRRNTAKEVDTLLADALTVAPSLAEAAVVGMWSGFRPGTPDFRPHIGLVPGFAGLIAATGHYRSGLAMAPVTAEVVRDLVVGGSCAYDLRRCAPGRRYGRS